MRADEITEVKVLAVFDAYSHAVARRDVEGVLELFATDPDVAMLGSEAGTKAVGREAVRDFLERAFARPVTYSFKLDEYLVSSAGHVAWLLADAKEHIQDRERVQSLPYRISMVLENRQGRWFIMQFHGSEPATAYEHESALTQAMEGN